MVNNKKGEEGAIRIGCLAGHFCLPASLVLIDEETLFNRVLKFLSFCVACHRFT